MADKGTRVESVSRPIKSEVIENGLTIREIIDGGRELIRGALQHGAVGEELHPVQIPGDSGT